MLKEQMAEGFIPRGILFRLESVHAVRNGHCFEDLTVRGNRQTGGIVFTYASAATGTSSSPEGQMIQEFRLPFSFFGLASPDRGGREITEKDIEEAIRTMPRSLYVP
ncbi:hypothetical protein HKD37_11G030826 [Glycine soja]